MDIACFVKAADAGKAPPVSLLHGPEPFLLDDAIARLSGAMFPGQSELSLVREMLDARSAGAESSLPRCSARPARRALPPATKSRAAGWCSRLDEAFKVARTSRTMGASARRLYHEGAG